MIEKAGVIHPDWTPPIPEDTKKASRSAGKDAVDLEDDFSKQAADRVAQPTKPKPVRE